MFLSKKTVVGLAVVAYAAAIITCLYLLFSSRTGGSFLSPWQVIHPAYIYVFAAATFLLGLLIVYTHSSVLPLKGGGRPTRLLLFFLMVFTFTLHAHVPLTHELFWGADGWRHMANEIRLLDGLPLTTAKLSAPATGFSEFQILNFKFQIGDLSYAEFWWLMVLVAKITSLSLVALTAWVVPVVWSVGFPVLLFTLGRGLGFSERWSLFLVWLSALPFALQTAGSFTLPVNLGFLIWLLALVLLIKQAAEPTKAKRIALIVLGIILTFGYALFAILFWLTLAVVYSTTCHSESRLSRDGPKNRLSTIFLLLSTALTLPAIELVTRYSSFDPHLQWLKQIKQFFGNFTALYLASGPRPHDIPAGNILFNQVPLAAFVQNIFTAQRWWLALFAIGFFVLVDYGIYLSFKNPKWRPIGILAAGLSLGYVISWYGLVGEHLLVRRLDVVLATLYLLLFVFSLFRLFSPHYIGGGYSNVRDSCSTAEAKAARGRPTPEGAQNDSGEFCNSQLKRGYLVSLFLLLILTFAIAASYSLGPDTKVVSTNEYRAMQYVWEQERGSAKHCVIADTYPLVALEAISKKEIIGGGFPINQYFAQPELTRTLEILRLSQSPSSTAATEEALRATGAPTCWLVGDFAFSKIPEKEFGEMAVRRYSR